MTDVLGQSVLNCKANPSYDKAGQFVLPLRMGKTQPSTAFKRAFTARIKAVREAKGLTQTQMATLLGLAQDTYKQYEGRTLMPHELIPIFCHHTGVPVTSLYPDWRIAVVHKLERKPAKPG